MMGSVALEARGIDWRRTLPLNVSFALRLNLHATPLERQVMLIGQGNKFELWDEARFTERRDQWLNGEADGLSLPEELEQLSL